MTREGWIGLLDQAANGGVRNVQFIGGEPTMHPDFPELLDHAVNIGLDVEVFSNLVHVSARCWTLFQRSGVRLATSYYSEARHGATWRAWASRGSAWTTSALSGEAHATKRWM
jgi:uncharacterized radical SAM superfamily Fe-S cluster-containing enzyme